MPGLLLDHVLAHLSLGGDCRRVAVRSTIAGGRSNRVTTPWALNTISGRVSAGLFLSRFVFIILPGPTVVAAMGRQSTQ
jgi:hypothetical protein